MIVAIFPVLLADAGKMVVAAYDIAATLGNACIDVGGGIQPVLREALGEGEYDPIPVDPEASIHIFQEFVVRDEVPMPYGACRV